MPLHVVIERRQVHRFLRVDESIQLELCAGGRIRRVSPRFAYQASQFDWLPPEVFEGGRGCTCVTSRDRITLAFSEQNNPRGQISRASVKLSPTGKRHLKHILTEVLADDQALWCGHEQLRNGSRVEYDLLYRVTSESPFRTEGVSNVRQRLPRGDPLMLTVVGARDRVDRAWHHATARRRQGGDRL